MKKILLGLTLLASISSSAETCSLYYLGDGYEVDDGTSQDTREATLTSDEVKLVNAFTDKGYSFTENVEEADDIITNVRILKKSGPMPNTFQLINYTAVVKAAIGFARKDLPLSEIHNPWGSSGSIIGKSVTPNKIKSASVSEAINKAIDEIEPCN